MEDFAKIITHARRFKGAVKELSVVQLEEVKGKLEGIIEVRKQELLEEEKENAQKIEKIKKYQQMMAADGLDIDDLQDVFSPQRRGVRPAKYEVYVDGKRITWSGQGRMPNVFRQKVDAGENISEYLID